MKEEKIVYIKVKDLKNNPKNPRKNDVAVDTVAKSIEKYGFRNPLIVDKNNVVWCGNTRLKASKKLGIKEVPCIIVEDLTEKQMAELALLDNKTNEIADWDTDMLSDILKEVDVEDFDLAWQLPLDPDLLGTDFTLPSEEKGDICQMTFTLHNEQAELIKYAIGLVKDDVFETFGNTNSNGNAIYEVVRQWAEQRK